MRCNRMLWLAVLAVLAALAAPAVAQANEVTKWNEIAQTTVLAQPPITSAPPAAVTFMAMVQGAVYDAVNAIDQTHRPYLLTRRFDQLASQEAAAATAAFRVLDPDVPGAAAESAAALRRVAGRRARGAGQGERDRRRDRRGRCDARPGARSPPGSSLRWGTDPGDWRPLPAADGSPLCDPSPWIASGLPFLLRARPSFARTARTTSTSAAYAEEFNEVKQLGALDSTKRTPEQTHIAVFLNSHPAPIWNGVARRLAEDPSRRLDLADTARLFAMLDLTAADAGINCWNDKYH